MFFFQAEDGIRDLVRSRGLGDVYKRQFLRLAGKESVRDLHQDARAVAHARIGADGAAVFELSLIHI